MTTSATGSNRAAGRAAFTLIEVSIAVFILATLVAISVPAFVRSYNSAQLDAAGRSLITSCQYARLVAVLRQQPATLHIDLDRQMYWIGQTLRTEAGESDPQVLKVVELPRRVALVSAERGEEAAVQRGQLEATFYANGTCDALTVIFRGAERGTGLAVVVDPLTARGTPYTVKL